MGLNIMWIRSGTINCDGSHFRRSVDAFIASMQSRRGLVLP